MSDNDKAEQLAEKWNVGFSTKIWRQKQCFYIHGHSSTVAITKLQAIKNYLK